MLADHENVIPLGPGTEAWIAFSDTGFNATLNTDADHSTVAIEMATQDDFHLLRFIGDLKITGNGEDFFVFKAPARLQVSFTPQDLNRAQRRGKPLALAYWYDGRWVRIPYGNVPATDQANGDNWAYFIIKEIPDPPIAWGT